MAVYGKQLLDPNSCKTVQEVATAFDQLAAALGYPAPDPGPGPDGTVPTSIGGTAIARTLVIFGEATADITVPSATFTIDGIVSFTDGYTHPTATQEVKNLFEITALENQPFLAIYSPEDGLWHAFTDIVGTGGTVDVTVNVISAKVNEAGGVYKSDATFAFDNATALLGSIVGSTGTATNFPADEYFDNEDIILVQADDSSWIPIRRDEPEIVPGLIVGEVPAATIAGGEIEFGVGTGGISVLKLNATADAYEADVTADAINISEGELDGTDRSIPVWAWKRREGYAVIPNPSVSVIGTYGYLLLDLPASGINGAVFPYTVTPTADAVQIVKLVYTGGAFKYDEALDDLGNPLIVDGVNPTNMPIESGIMIPGNLITVNGEQLFEVQWSDYKYGIAGWSAAAQQFMGHDENDELSHITVTEEVVVTDNASLATSGTTLTLNFKTQQKKFLFASDASVVDDTASVSGTSC